jgi:hypothetical protein
MHGAAGARMPAARLILVWKGSGMEDSGKVKRPKGALLLVIGLITFSALIYLSIIYKVLKFGP